MKTSWNEYKYIAPNNQITQREFEASLSMKTILSSMLFTKQAVSHIVRSELQKCGKLLSRTTIFRENTEYFSISHQK